MLSDKPAIQDLVRRLVAHGLRHAVISPGSRHAPLSLSFYNHPKVECHVLPDERAAGYFALGIAQHTRSAVALISTSGTAAMNYGPAIAEAFYQEVPLLVLTADRPVEWVDQGDGQTIRQRNLHQLHCLASYELAIEDRHGDVQRSNERMVSEAWNTAHGKVFGPVHLNVPLREPLYGMAPVMDKAIKPIEVYEVDSILSEAQLDELRSRIDRAKKVWVLTGMHPPDAALSQSLNRFAEHPQVVVLTETGSNLKGAYFIDTIDRMLMGLNEEELRDFAPELLITFGSNVVSKKVKAYLRKHLSGAHWHLDPAGRQLDTFQRLEAVLPLRPAAFFTQLAPRESLVASDESYRDRYVEKHRQLESRFNHFLLDCPWCDLSLYRSILPALPSNSILQMGNSSVVRYIQLFAQRADLTYYGNRGTSGIDGCTATASGMAKVADRTVTLITGDIAFFYDINGLWQKDLSKALKIILINNGGGSIFKIIDGPSQTNALEEVFESRHRQKAVHLAAHFGLAYQGVSHPDRVDAGLQWLYAERGPALLEFDTASSENEHWLKEMFKHLK